MVLYGLCYWYQSKFWQLHFVQAAALVLAVWEGQIEGLELLNKPKKRIKI